MQTITMTPSLMALSQQMARFTRRYLDNSYPVKYVPKISDTFFIVLWTKNR